MCIAEVKRLYWEYFPPLGTKRSPNGRTGICLCVKQESECDPHDFNFLDKELIYMAQIDGARQKYIKMVLKRFKITESVRESMSSSCTSVSVSADVEADS